MEKRFSMKTENCVYKGLLFGLFLASAPCCRGAEFHILGQLENANDFRLPFRSLALAVSADGEVVLGVVDGRPPGTTPVLWTRESGIEEISTPREFFPAGGFLRLGGVSATSLSADGSTVVGHLYSGFHIVRAPFRSVAGRENALLVDREIVRCPEQQDSICFQSLAYDVNGDGSVVVGDLNSQAFRWTEPSGMTELGWLDTSHDRSVAVAVSDDGTVIVGESGTRSDGLGFGFESDSLVSAFRWSEEEGMIRLPTTNETDSARVRAVSPDGSLIAGASGPRDSLEATIWFGTSKTQKLGFLQDDHLISEAVAMSADGSVVVGSSRGEFIPSSHFVWDVEFGMRRLDEYLSAHGVDFSGYTDLSVNDISADAGVLVGSAWSVAEETSVGWVAIVPEPNPFGWHIVLFALFAIRKCRKARRDFTLSRHVA